jgi:membrane-bound ClpP family serine protease
LRSDIAEQTGFGFLNAQTTFAALTVVAGIVGVLSALLNIFALRERSLRWWYAGLGLFGLIFVADNALRPRAALALGGMLATLGAAALVAQVILPRGGQAHASPGRSTDTVLGLIRVLIATLWFTQLLWKLPWNNYGCESFPQVAGASGLCHWIAREIAEPRWPLYQTFLKEFVVPNLNWLAIFIFAGEAVICFSFMLGLFTRLGAISALLMGTNLFIGLTGIPVEWDWTYLMLIATGAMFIPVGGRYVGLDAILNRRLRKWADSGSRLARVLAWMT